MSVHPHFKAAKFETMNSKNSSVRRTPSIFSIAKSRSGKKLSRESRL
jgi:hypothetical protein